MIKMIKYTTTVILIISSLIFAQGKIDGNVTGLDGSALPGANVILEGTTLGAAVDIDGYYLIRDVPPGDYTVVVSAIGYKGEDQTVTVTDGEVSEASFVLGTDVLGLTALVVTGVVNPVSKLESSVSISTLDIRDTEQSAPRTTAEIFRTIPGIRSEASGGDGNTNITVRGVPISAGGSKYLQLQEDGLPVLQFGDIAFATADIFLRADNTVGRIEAIRGGSASTMASNSPAGIINFISKYGSVAGGSIRTTVGIDYNSFRVDFGYGAPLTDDLSYYLGGFYRLGEGPRTAGYNANNGGQLKMNLTKQFDGGYARLHFKHLNDRSAAYMPMPLKVEGTNADPTWGSIDGYDGNHGTMHSTYLLQNLGIGVDGELRRIDVADGMHPVSNAVGLEFVRKIGDGWKVENRARYAMNAGRFVAPFPAEIASASAMAESIGGEGATLKFTDGTSFGSGLAMRIHMFDTELNNFNNFANDLKVSKSLGMADVTVGLYKSYQSISMSWLWNSYVMEVVGDGARLADVYAADGTKLSENGLYAYGVPAWGNCCQRNYDTDYETTAPYASVAVEVNDAINVDASVRMDKGHVTGSFAGAVQTTYDVNNDGVISPNEESVSAIDNANSTPVDYEYDFLSYSTGANYKLNDDMAVFARYSRGGSAKADRLLFGRDQYMDGEKMAAKDMIDQAELGYKHNLSFGGLFVTGFYAKTAEEGGYEATTQKTIENDYKAMGVEVEGAFDFGDIDVRGGLTYTNAEITSGDNKGNIPRRQPAVMFNLVPTYTMGGNSTGLSLIGQTKAYAQDSNELVMPGYLIVNVFVNVKIAEGLLATLNGNNLLNALGITESEEGSITENTVNYVRARPITGRTITVSLDYTF